MPQPFVLVRYGEPAIVAHQRKVPNFGSVLIINTFLGWTVLGWVVALAMAARSVPESQVAGPAPSMSVAPSGEPGTASAVLSAAELERLADLHERGVLTDEEFQQAKARLLG